MCVSVSYVDIFGQAEEYVDVWELEHCGNLAEGKVGRSTVCVCVCVKTHSNQIAN